MKNECFISVFRNVFVFLAMHIVLLTSMITMCSVRNMSHTDNFPFYTNVCSLYCDTYSTYMYIVLYLHPHMYIYKFILPVLVKPASVSVATYILLASFQYYGVRCAPHISGAGISASSILPCQVPFHPSSQMDYFCRYHTLLGFIASIMYYIYSLLLLLQNTRMQCIAPIC